MAAEPSAVSELELGHVLFMDIVGYSKLLVDEQSNLSGWLNSIVRGTEQVRTAEAKGKLIRLPTGDGMALVFFTSPETPMQCALEISRALKENAAIKLRMGLHSGPVNAVSDVNERENVAGVGINVAQRVMDCGDSGHILLSKRLADDLAQYTRWRDDLHDLGDVEVKHGAKIGLVNFFNGEVGRAELPEKVRLARKEQAAAKRRRRGVLAGAALLFAALIALFIYQRHLFRSPAGEPSSEKSVAVLPFENLSKDEENAFFAGGVQDEILTNLAKIADLKVISRTSVMKYKTGPERNLREIARNLGVSHVVEGSVQRAGERVRVTAQLIDARNDAHLWAEHYDRDFADILAIQSEIAQKIADQLRAKLSATEKAAIAERPTNDLAAYALYTKAKEIEWGDWEGVDKALSRQLELLEKATQRDPDFALAYCELSAVHTALSAQGADLSKSQMHLDLAKQAADTAVRLRPDLGDAHLALAWYYYFVGINTSNFDKVRDELTIALRTLPNDAEAILMGARIDKRQNRWDDSLANFQKARELDPLNGEVAYFLGRTLLEMRRYQELEQHLAKNVASGLLRAPWTQFRLAELKLAQGDPGAAQALLDQVPLEFSPLEDLWRLRFTVALYLRDYDAAERVIAATPAKWAERAFDGQPPETRANGQVARARGDQRKALAAFAGARKRLEATSEIKFKDQPYFALAVFAELDAGLGRKEDAIREALQAVELMPIAKDSYWGPGQVTNLALVYAWTGERERALEQLEVVAKIPVGGSESAATYGDLKFNPCWDSLRGDPRFDKIVAAAKAASR